MQRLPSMFPNFVKWMVALAAYRCAFEIRWCRHESALFCDAQLRQFPHRGITIPVWVHAIIGEFRLEAALGIGQDSVIVDKANMGFLRIALQPAVQLFDGCRRLEAWFPRKRAGRNNGRQRYLNMMSAR